jgi:hypothetical protein
MYWESGRSILTFFGSGNISGDMFAAALISTSKQGTNQVQENNVTLFTMNLFSSIIYNRIFCNNPIQLRRDRGQTASFHHVLRQFLS